MSQNKMKLKLLIETKAQKVLFAEAEKDFVDFLFHIFSFSIGKVVNLLTKEGMVGTLGNLYKSIEELNTSYMPPNVTKETILVPKVESCTSTSVNVPLLRLNATVSGSREKRFFTCPDAEYYDVEDKPYFATAHRERYFTDAEGATCPGCKTKMSTAMTYVPDPDSKDQTRSLSIGSSSRYVKEVASYMVMDNLEVKPISVISGITLMQKFNVKELSSLVEKEVEVGHNEGVALLKASFNSETVLTNIFLRTPILSYTV